MHKIQATEPSCARCGRVFAVTRSEARRSIDGLVCRRPCTIHPLEVEERADREGCVRYRSEYAGTGR